MGHCLCRLAFDLQCYTTWVLGAVDDRGDSVPAAIAAVVATSLVGHGGLLLISPTLECYYQYHRACSSRFPSAALDTMPRTRYYNG